VAKTAADSQKLRAGDRVRLGTREGEVTIGSVPVDPPAFVTDVPREHMVRVCWDGNTFSTIADARGLVKL
jgi:hypothetical protein